MGAARLDLVDQQLAADFASATAGQQLKAAAGAVKAAFTRCGMTEPFVALRADGSFSMEKSDRASLERRQAEVEAQYFELQAKFEKSADSLSERDSEARDCWFSEARALQALLHLADRKYAEAVYEAVHAGSGEQAAAAEVHQLLRAETD